MERVSTKLTVFFEEPFWVGVYERVTDERLEAAKVTFGAEPKDCEVYDYFLKNFCGLRFSPPVLKAGKEQKVNPKRMRRVVNRQLLQTGIGTKAQQALKLQQENSKQQRKCLHREKAEEDKERRFEIRQQKRKEKHKGR